MSHFRSTLIYTGVAGTPWYMTLKRDGSTGTPAGFYTAVSILADSLAQATTEAVTISYDGLVYELDDSDEDVVGVTSDTAAFWQGENVSDPLPYQTQFVVNLRTAAVVTGPGGRSRLVQGRINVPGFCENQTTGGVWAAAFVGQITGYFQTFMLGDPMVVYSPTGSLTAPVTSIGAKQTPFVLKSRRD